MLQSVRAYLNEHGDEGHQPSSSQRLQGKPDRGSFVSLIRSIMDSVDLFFRALLFLVLMGELGLILAEIARRVIADKSFLWAEEISRLVLLILTFIGGALAYRAQHHSAIAFITKQMPQRVQASFAASIDILILIIACVVGYAALDLLAINWQSILPMLQWNAGIMVIPCIVGMGLIAMFAVERIVLDHRLPATVTGAIGALMVGLAAQKGLALFGLAPTNGIALVVMLIMFLIFVLLGLPVGFAMLLGSLLFLNITDMAPAVAVAQNTIDGSGHFILLTLPFFIWAGMIMEKGGISLRLVGLAMAIVGHLRGGLLQVVVITTYLVSGVSGSKIADVVAVGSVLRDELRRKGYKEKDGAAVLSASAAMSETIPPSIAMLVLGSVVPVSIGAMFIAGLLPAALLAGILMTIVYFRTPRDISLTMRRATRAELSIAALRAILPLLMPAILILGIKFGVATPTEVSSAAVLYGIIISMLVYKAIGLQSFVRIAVSCAILSGMVLFIIAAAASFAWIMAAGNMPQYLLSILHAGGDNKYLFLLGSILILIIVGSLLEGLPALIILGPILYPIAVGFGIDGVHYAMVLLLSMGVGIFMPPIGIGFYVACSVMGSTLEDTAKAVVPYIIALVAGIMVVAFFPWISLAPLHLLGR